MYALSNVQSIATTVSNGIEAEVNQLRDDANQRIGPREIARDMINEFLPDWPMIVKGQHMVSYIDDRGETQVKLQDKNLSLWIVALQTTIEVGHTSYHLLGSTFTAWAKDALKGVEWDKEKSVKVARTFVKVMQQNGILNNKSELMDYVDDHGVTQEARVVRLSQACKDTMHNVSMDMRERSSMVCKPLRNQPQDWTDAVTGIGEQAGIPLITRSQLRTNEIAAPVLSAVNKLQAVEFVVSPHIIDAAYDMLDNQHEYSSTEEELRMYREVLSYENGSYYFPVTMDTRGRMYYRGGLLTPQGMEFCKAAFQFATFEPLGLDGIDAICIHTANVLGFDKYSIADRISTIENLVDNELLDLDIDHRLVKVMWPESDVFQATVALNELQRIININLNGCDMEDVQSNLVCHQDGTCNGLQHMAAITHNKQTAIAVNCVASTTSEIPADIYGIIADAAAMLEDHVQTHELITRYGRSMAKNPVMITGYGAGEDTIIANTQAFLAKKGITVNVEPLGAAIGKAYCKAIDNHAGAVKALTEALKARVKARVESGQVKFSWTTADGFEACTEYRDHEVNRVRAGKFNALVRNMFPAPLDEVKTVGAMAPNFIHSIDGTHLRMVVNDCNHSLVTVHDSIGSHAKNFFTTADSIRAKFVEVHKYDAIGNLCDNMQVRTPKFRGEYDAVEALESTYIFS